MGGNDYLISAKTFEYRAETLNDGSVVEESFLFCEILFAEHG
jgi:hypothetical protein